MQVLSPLRKDTFAGAVSLNARLREVCNPSRRGILEINDILVDTDEVLNNMAADAKMDFNGLHDMEYKEIWGQIPCKGKYPTPEEQENQQMIIELSNFYSAECEKKGFEEGFKR